MTLAVLFIFLGVINSLKIWVPNTDLDNKFNWENENVPNDCDYIQFVDETEVITYWNLNKLIVSGLSLPQTGDVVFSRDVDIRFRNKEKCPQGKAVKFIRHDIKGWLDPDNWKSESNNLWLPHSERVPCAGEKILFPPQKTFAVQLPNILVPIGGVTFDTEVFAGDSWSEFLKSDLGFQLFKGPDNLRSLPWRNDIGCLNKKNCICGRSSYTIRDGKYVDTPPHIFEEAVCLYAMPKCKPSECLSPVKPEGHCCAICGAVIKIEDNTAEGIDLQEIKTKVDLAAPKQNPNIKTYVGRTKDKNIQIVVVAENSDDTIESHAMANIIRQKLIDQQLKAKITSHVSGLRFSNYLFNSVSGIVFTTLIAVVTLFASLYYIYLVLPKKKFPSSGSMTPFMFARFENAASENNVEIGVEPEVSEQLPQAFSNPMYSGSSESNVKPPKETSADIEDAPKESLHVKESSETKEYSNPVYSELEKTNNLDDFLKEPQGDPEDEEFSEIKL